MVPRITIAHDQEFRRTIESRLVLGTREELIKQAIKLVSAYPQHQGDVWFKIEIPGDETIEINLADLVARDYLGV